MSYLRGDLPQALEAYADAGAQFDALGITSVDLVLDQATSYLAGGLADDALAVAEQALVARPLLARERADLLVSVAESALAAGDWSRAASAADEGAALMRAQSRHAPSLEADLFAITARDRAGTARRSAAAPRRAAGRTGCARPRCRSCAQALLLGARLARDVRSARAAALADEWLDEASASRRARTHAVRALGWLALAQRRDAAGDSRRRAAGVRPRPPGARRAPGDPRQPGAARGDVGPRRRARRARHPDGPGVGRQPPPAPVVRALARQRARGAVGRRRRTTRRRPPTSPPCAPSTSVLAEARAEGERTDQLQARVTRLEQSVRRRLLHARGTGETAAVARRRRAPRRAAPRTTPCWSSWPRSTASLPRPRRRARPRPPPARR